MFDHNLLCFVVASLVIKPIFAQNANSTLQLVHILFRHGERTTDRFTLYPKDPHINETYYPYGLGELTNKGKQTEYKLGKFFRARYDDFLGKIYTPDILEAFSSNSNRTKMSLQLVLAGLFPPVGEQIWENGLNWQPIPFTALPRAQDKLFFGILCPNFKKLYQELVTSPKISQEFKKNEEIFRYLSENTGLEIKTYWDVFFLYMCLRTEDEYGLKLPEWTTKVYPEKLKALAIKSYGLLTATTELRRLVAGHLLKKIVDDSKAKTANKLIPENRKIFLYSGHEFNIAHLLQTLDIFEPRLPSYGASVIFELHKMNGVDGFKILYHNYKTEEPQLLILPGCEEFCPLNKFHSLIEEYLPEEVSCAPASF